MGIKHSNKQFNFYPVQKPGQVGWQCAGRLQQFFVSRTKICLPEQHFPPFSGITGNKAPTTMHKVNVKYGKNRNAGGNLFQAGGKMKFTARLHCRPAQEQQLPKAGAAQSMCFANPGCYGSR
ncbi:hypothetical protein C7N43_38505 [Sphingobacteriales bacterium UPWRP_1]|nr:hypothetical protein B6N25_10690 [Sphingobacteriales bacterium TSM_CSS]PSJ71598.1 hypothetical protein C7N43_38505 [Sphingobacteriales bacterium UPWRP_1]